MTSDGITDEDWDPVRELAARIVNATSEPVGPPKFLAHELPAWLDALQKKYGELPSILATRADYIDDPKTRLRLLESAWLAAQNLADAPNSTFIASSLVEFLFEEARDPVRGREWLDRLAESLEKYWDDGEYEIYRHWAARDATRS